MLESVERDLVVQHPARELVAKYLTEAHARTLLLNCARAEASQAAHLLPVAFKLCSQSLAIAKMGCDGNSNTSSNANSKSKSKQQKTALPAAPSSPPLSSELEIYCVAWVGAVDVVKSALAKAVAEVFCSANQEVRFVSSTSLLFNLFLLLFTSFYPMYRHFCWRAFHSLLFAHSNSCRLLG